MATHAGLGAARHQQQRVGARRTTSHEVALILLRQLDGVPHLHLQPAAECMHHWVSACALMPMLCLETHTAVGLPPRAAAQSPAIAGAGVVARRALQRRFRDHK
jgi:hypothetical protein